MVNSYNLVSTSLRVLFILSSSLSLEDLSKSFKCENLFVNSVIFYIVGGYVYYYFYSS